MAEQKKQPAKQSTKEPAKEPTKQAAKEPAKQTAKEPAKQTAKEPAKQTAKEPAKQTAKEPAKQTAKEPAKQTTKQAPKQHTIVQAEGSSATTHNVKPAPATSGNATGLRIGAVVLWVVAVVLEILAVMILNGSIALSFLPSLAQIIIALVLDLICVIIGAQLWKKANRIDPASEKNKVKFWLWNNMGVIACVIAFVPFIIIALTNKDADAKLKRTAVIVAIVALLIGGVASYDFNPISAEQKAEAIAEYGETTVYWTPFGKVYHTHEDCHAMNRTDTITAGTVQQAIEANRTRLCKYCENRDMEGDVESGAGDID